jgi:hypothetical protein
MPKTSLQQLLVLFAMVALAIVSLRYASAWWQVAILCLTLAVFFGMVIVALVGRGARQAFAIGMAVVMGGYAFLQSREPDPTPINIGLPSTYLLVRLQRAIGEVRYFDAQTTQEVVGYNPVTASPNGPRVYPDTVPMLKHVLPIGHCWLALLLGFIGGCFARSVSLGRAKEVRPLP